jgi:hypothetical protein
MYFSVDNNKKIIFGWSTKCGCSHIKKIYWFLQTDNIDNDIHTEKDVNSLPDDIENYTTLIFCRNPYKRLVSGFLDKYGPTGEYLHLWKHSSISFSQFVDEVVRKNWSMIHYNHFTPQTTAAFDKKILFSKIIKFYDITNIDYHYIEQLYNKKIPEYLVNCKGGHERATQIKKPDIFFDEYVYDLNMDEYIDYPVDTKYFYSEEIKQKVFNFYIDDFIFFKENGFDYINSDI